MSGRRWAAAAAGAIVLIGLAWAMDERTRPAPSMTEAGVDTPRDLAAVLTGFRPDAWYLPDDSLLGFVEIPTGPLVMGSDPTVDSLAFDNERWSRDQAQGTLDVPTYFIGRYEVTVAQLAAFARETDHPVAPEALRAPPDHPAAYVSWPDALAYARWLGRALAAWPGTPEAVATRLREGWRVTIPDEAQWERAARGGDGRIYPWGDDARSDRANFRGRATRPVGAVPCAECAFGLADMSGNVWEWTRSPYQPYPYDPRDDRATLGDEALWVMRGGSFGDDQRNVRAAARGGADPGVRRPFIGFRVVLTRE